MLTKNHNEEMWNGEISLMVLMTKDFTGTPTGGGERTYRAGNKYVIDNEVAGLMENCPDLVGETSYGHHSQGVRAEYTQVCIIPRVTKWISSTGIDTIELVKGKKISVPSNLAAHLITHNQATA